MERITLFDSRNENIHINIEAYFSEEKLVIDGYDIGKTVEEYWGDSDYEYMVTISEAGVEFLYHHFAIQTGDKEGLLKALAERYHSNYCYSEIRTLLDDHKIKYEGFTWT